MANILDKMRENPAHGWRIADVKTVCDQNGVTCQPPTGGGSHYKIYHAARPDILTVPFKRPIKPIYIRKLVSFIEAVKVKE